MALVLLVAIVAAGLVGVARASAADSDFQMTVEPAAQSLAPGTETSFTVEIASVGGFADPVDLSLGDLLPGVTASISPTSVVPPAIATIHVTAGLGTIPGTYAITVVGTSGAIRHESSGQATVDFGLTPICYGAFSGTVTDSVSGAALADVPVFLDGPDPVTHTDAAGHYAIPQVRLDSNNPTPHTVRVGVQPIVGYEPDPHWYEEQAPTATCGVPQIVDFALMPVARATIGGRVTVGEVVGGDYAHPVSTGTAIEGAAVREFHSDTTTSAADGSYGLSPNLNYHNVPLDGATVFVSKDGYWPASPALGPIDAGDVVPLDVPLVPVCTATVSGRLTDAATGQPIRDWTVDVDSLFFAPWATQTDDAGNYSLTETLDYNNAPIHYLLAGASASPPDGRSYVAEQSQLVDLLFAHCGESQVIDLSLTPRAPQTPNYGSLDGYVDDQDTGQPLEGVCVGAGLGTEGCLARTDATGYWHADQVLVSSDSSSSSTPFGPIDVTLDGYWRGSTEAFPLVANSLTHVGTTLLLRVRFGALHGVVLDAVTHLPIANAEIRPSLDTTTAEDGTFATGPLPLLFDNAPIDTFVSASANGYWPLSVPVTITATTDPFVTIPLVPICKGATIAGRVVDAVTGAPIAEAAVAVGLGRGVTLTDTDGRYRFDDVQVGDQNSPVALELTASAPGYFPQTREVTVFCGASLTIDFGRVPQTGGIEGYVTDDVTGKPMPHVFIGSGFGGAVETDDSGYYHFAAVPVNDDGTDRAWDVTAAPADFDAQTKSAVVHAGATARVDFVFGGTAPPPTVVHVSKVCPSGAASPADVFQVTLNGAGVGAPISCGGSIDVTVSAGTAYSIGESGSNLGAYDREAGAGCVGTLDFGGSASCVLTNTLRPAPVVHVSKVCPSGPAAAGDTFQVTLNGAAVGAAISCGGSIDVTVAAGSAYSVGESGSSLGAYDRGAGAGCAATLDFGGSASCVLTNTLRPAPVVHVSKVCPSGAASPSDLFQVTLNGAGVGAPISCGGSIDVTVAAGSAYSVGESGSSLGAYDRQAGAGCVGTLDYGGAAVCTLTNTLRPAPVVHVSKVCPLGPAAAADTFQVTLNGSAVGAPIACGGSIDVTVPATATYAIGETGADLAAYDRQATASCSGALDRGQSAACSLTNTVRRATVSVRKTVGGAPLTSSLPSNEQSFTFQLRQGATAAGAGSVLEQQDATVSNGGVATFATPLAANSPYQLCELVSAGWTTNLAAPFSAGGAAGVTCTTFTAAPGEAKTIAVDNTPPAAAAQPRTIGYWKNWSSCSGSSGGQTPLLDRTLAAAGPGGVAVGTLVLHGSTSTPDRAPDCLAAIRLLDKSTVDKAKSMASDPAFNLAAQLLGAKLNGLAHATTCPAAASAIASAQALLVGVAFNGIAHGALTAPVAARANELATTLDTFNNGRLC